MFVMRLRRNSRYLLVFCLCIAVFLIVVRIQWLCGQCASGPKSDCNSDLLLLKQEVAWLWKKLVSCVPSASNVQWRTEFQDSTLPTIYVVTPTYSRPTQKADLTRLSHTLMLVRNLHWIVVEDGVATTPLVRDFLVRSGLSFTHLNAPTQDKFKLASNQPNWLKPRGVSQRNAALDWLRSFESGIKSDANGVVYFADDDNTYDLQLFEEMRSTKKVSTWPVGLVGGLKWEGPKVKDGRVIGWIAAWKPERPFAIDMAGFAVNLQFLLQNSRAKFRADVPRGFVESSFLKKLVKMNELEPKAEDCTKVLVWHTRTEKVKLYSSEELSRLSMDLSIFNKAEV